MLSISSRRFTLKNKIPFFYFLDEATTFKIEEFEKMPSVLREYLCGFTLLTQSAAKIEKLYGRLDRSSIEANFSNQFYGRTKDIEALKSYPLVFGKAEKQRISRTTGSSRGQTAGAKRFLCKKKKCMIRVSLLI
ncbi:type IV secretory system conjugative DNA transfer family protein (plasmid) [Bacteroides fragilis]|nr:type IV secretory system conjugative DNA transfer family protein [Bacteroides fragilis]